MSNTEEKEINFDEENIETTLSSTSFIGIDDSDIHYHEPLLRNLLDDATQKINDHMFRLKIRLEYENREEMNRFKQQHEEIVTQNESRIKELEYKLSQQEDLNKSQSQEYERLLETSAKVFERAIKIQELKISFLIWKHNAEEANLQKNMEELASNLSQNSEKSKEYIEKVKSLYEAEKEDIVTTMKTHTDKITTDMIKKYEAEIFFLNRELELSRQQAHHERTLRQQLENELRQMFLQNMTSMNIEAFRIFQKAAETRESFENELQQKLVQDDSPSDNIRESNISRSMSGPFEVVDVGKGYDPTSANIIRHSSTKFQSRK